MAWISFGALPCRKKKKTWWQLASRCRWNRARPWHAYELVSFLVGLKTYQHPCTVASLRSVVFLYRDEQDVNAARRISVVACNWIMAPTKRGVADESRICKDNLSNTPLFTETVGTARLVLSVREAFLEWKYISGTITTKNVKEHGK